jgi:endonuclease YncB( thermonuclease family)
MLKRALLILLASLLAGLISPDVSAAKVRPYCRAVDGDSLRCGWERIRLYDVYAAELNEPGGREARANLRRLIRSGELRIVRRGKDRYGRTLADLYVNGHKIVQEDIGPRAGRGTRSGHASRPQ